MNTWKSFRFHDLTYQPVIHNKKKFADYIFSLYVWEDNAAGLH